MDVAIAIDSPARGDARLIESLLADQGDLTAVERFAQFHEETREPLQSRYYASLLPASPPGPGQQLAFEVDLDRCSGCKACVAACHALNGLDDHESWRDVGMILGGPAGLPVLQHVTSSCHHCLDPACLNACPVDAYEKDPVTGIVKHLDDQCFGCQYCTLACPYDAPKFHAGKGIVRKCDMCSDRLGAGEAPACVQACPHEAIRIRVVDVADVLDAAATGHFLPAAPEPGYTQPTTRYLSGRPWQGDFRPADHHRIEPEHAHLPLVIMLVMTQASVGGFALDLAGRAVGPGPALLPILSLGLGLAGLAASTCHLGRPLYAYRAIIGLRHSWLSREVVAFGLFAKLAIARVALAGLRPGWYEARPALRLALAAGVVLAGLAGVFSSVMVYHVVRRPFWRAGQGGARFAGTTLLLGLATALMAATWSPVVGQGTAPGTLGRGLALGMMLAAIARLRSDASVLAHREDEELTPLRKSALLILGPLAPIWRVRVASIALGGLAIPAALALAGPAIPAIAQAALAGFAFLAAMVGELAERHLFFAAVTRPRMPGGVMR